MNKPREDGAPEKLAAVAQSQRDVSAPPRTWEGRRKGVCSFLCRQIGAGSSAPGVGWEQDGIALSFRADVRSLSPAGQWLSSRQVRSCAGWRFLSGTA